jgi:hypothetical protein
MWPDMFEQQDALLREGNVLLARIEVRERAERMTSAIQAVVACDAETGLPTGFDPSKFRPGAGRRPRRGSSSDAGAANGRHTPPRVLEAVPASEPAARPARAAEPPPPAYSNGNGRAPAPDSNGRPFEGPPRLRIRMEETTDEAADRRRVARIFKLLAARPGEHPVELEVRTRSGRSEVLRLPAGVDDVDAVVSELRVLLGVLGMAERIGGEAPAEASPVLAASRAV